MTDEYSDPSSLNFHSEPEPQPPALGLTNGAHDTHTTSTGGPVKPHKPTSPTDGCEAETQTESRDQERTWTSLSLPGAMLNSTIYVIGRSIELLAPYWPSSQEREKLVTWARSHPVLASFLLFQALFVLVPIISFAAFMASLTVAVVGVAVLLVVGVGLGFGVMVFIPGALSAAVWGAIIWAVVFVGWRVAGSFWEMYKHSKHYQNLHTASDAHCDDSERKGLRKQQARSGDQGAENGNSQTNFLHEEFKGPTSEGSFAFSEGTNTPKEEEYCDQHTHGKGGLKKEREYTDVLKQGGRDEDRVERDIAASLG